MNYLGIEIRMNFDEVWRDDVGNQKINGNLRKNHTSVVIQLRLNHGH